ncbi:glycosyltransferase family 4 protein [Brevundimonas staleyi]|uniref:Glycosyltransferase family 4 protein n=1 Tax=Brevundimonas staleyi TaxID=74326 RepID=A0ABW0FNE8_9CAUL
MTRSGVVVVTCEYEPFPGGIGTYATRLVEAVRVQGHGALVVAPDYPELGSPADGEAHRLFRHHRISLVALFRLLKVLRSAPRDWPVLAADIRSVVALSLLRPLHRRPYTAMIHGSEVAKLASRSPASLIARRAYGGAEAIYANSRATLAAFEGVLPDAPPGRVTYLGVEPDWFEHAPGPFEHPALAGIAPEATVVCTVGRLEARKGHTDVIRALTGQGEIVFVAAGRAESAAYVAELERIAVETGVRLVLPGAVSRHDLKRLFARSACHVLAARDLPGKTEGFGLVLLEAAAQGCPSVATRAGGVPEVMGETGMLTPQGDVAALAAAIRTYVDDPERRTLDGREARERARTFSWQACAMATLPTLDWDRPAGREA